MSLVPSILALGLALVAAYMLASRRPSSALNNLERRLAASTLAFTTIAQCIHFTEESLTGFHTEFPKLFGLSAIPLPVFIGFNVAWIAVWFASIPGVRAGKKFAYFASWFLAIAGMLNFVAHPAMSLIVSGYFPGLISSPLIGGMSVWLWVRLYRATARGH